MPDSDPEDTDELLLCEIAWTIEHGGAFDWLLDEPDLYTVEDGEPV